MSFASINGQEIFFEDSGGTGFPLIMMHGFLMDQSLFDPQVKALAPEFRCIRFDARGFGKTIWDKSPFSLYDTASDCVRLMDHLGIDKAVVVGMSQGGYAALRLALHFPRRIAGLVLMSTWAGVDDEVTKGQFRQARDTWVNAGPLDPLVESYATFFLGPKEASEAHWKKWIPRWKAYSGTAIFHAMNNLLDRDDISGLVSRIQAPALVTHGDADRGMPMALGKRLSEALPNCKAFVPIHGAAHAANYTHADAINPGLLEFLRTIVMPA